MWLIGFIHHQRLQEKVIKKHKEYSVLAEELSALLDERHPERKIERVDQLKMLPGLFQTEN